MGTYSATKAALHSFSESLDMELCPFGVRVMLLAPGMIRSNIGENAAALRVAPPADSLYTAFHNTLGPTPNGLPNGLPNGTHSRNQCKALALPYEM
jgi:NAD(P)-dependent dehydrogenase (short-subunit alcohol dehydrogenase family)